MADRAHTRTTGVLHDGASIAAQRGRAATARTTPADGYNHRASLTMPASPQPWRAVATAMVVALLALAWSLPITTRMIVDGDFPQHLQLAEAVAAHPHLPAPHFLFFVTVAVLMRLLAISSQWAGIVVISLIHLGTVGVIAAYLRRQTRAPSVAAVSMTAMSVATVVVTIGLLMAGPILPPFVELTTNLIGYSPPNSYHNATFIVSKPFCLLLLFTTAAAFDLTPRSGLAARLAAVVVLSAISKPNYLSCVVPAALLYACWRWPRRKGNQLALATLAVVATGLVLAMQRAYADNDIQVVFAPFAALRFHTAIDLSLSGKVLASLAFPLTVVLLWPRVVVRRHDLMLAWLAAVAAFAQGFLLAEGGVRMDHGNLLVAAPQAVFVLMVVSAGVLMSLPSAASAGEGARRAMAWTILGLHVIGGWRHVFVRVQPPSFLRPLTVVALLLFVAWAAWTARRCSSDTPEPQAAVGG